MPLQFLWKWKVQFLQPKTTVRERKECSLFSKKGRIQLTGNVCISEGFVEITSRYWLYLHTNNAISSCSQALDMFKIKQYRFNLATKPFLWEDWKQQGLIANRLAPCIPRLCPYCINFVFSPYHGWQPLKARSSRCRLASEYQLPKETIMFAQWGHEFSSCSSGMLY